MKKGPAKNSPKTFLGVPLMRIFWLLVYSVLLCLFVGVSVYFFILSQQETLQLYENQGSLKNATVFPKTNLEPSPTLSRESFSLNEFKYQVEDVLNRGDFELLISYILPKSYDCVGDTGGLNYKVVYGPILSETVKRGCEEEGVPIVQNPPQKVYLYSLGCYKCGPGLLGKTSYVKALKEHSVDRKYILKKEISSFGNFPSYLFQNSLGDYLLVGVVDTGSRLYIGKITPINSSEPLSEIIGD